MFHISRAARRRVLGTVVAGGVTVAMLAAAPPSAVAEDQDGAGGAGGLVEVDRGSVDLSALASFEDGRYIVLLQQPGLAAYDGGTRGLSATKPAAGRTLRTDGAAYTAYRSFLTRQQRGLASSVGATVQRSYTVAANGFAASLTGEQAAELSASKGVLTVVPVERRSPDARLRNNSAKFLDMYGPDGGWRGNGATQANAGAGVVIGDIDSGIWPENKSFTGEPLTSAPRGPFKASMDPLGNTKMDKVDGGVFRGACETGEEFALSDCSTKIIGARYYPASFLDTVPPADRSETEYISPRDGGGHGSHTASTAAGNVARGVRVDGIRFGEVTGMVPGASIAVYKVCFDDTDPDTGGCYTDAILSAIDDAVRDGVDVLNFSISGATDTIVDPVEIAFAGAASAGVFVSASAGNSGPTASTVAHNSPWLTTVAASTYRNFDGTVELGNGDTYLGATASSVGAGPAPLVDSATANDADSTTADAQLCKLNTLDPADVAGKIVLCLRGVNDRVEKSAEVERAGGVGMILVNPSENSLDADLHSVPTVHLPDTDRAAIYAYAATTGPTATLIPGNETEEASAALPQVSGFSSRGPAIANDSDILKPDIAAPGSNVLAAVAPPSNSGRNFDLYSGTSMAAPHIAGLGAFLLAKNPTWTPQMVQSAMMTTATPTLKPDGETSSDAFAQGAGEVTPTEMFEPGLFVAATTKSWYRLISDQGLDTGVAPRSAKSINVPSMADHAVVGSTSFTRFFNSQMAGTWKVRGGVPGFDLVPSASSLTLNKAGIRRQLSFEFTAKPGTQLETWRKGAIRLVGPTTVRLPVALQATAVDAPAVVRGTGVDGSEDVTVTSGIDGDIDLNPVGLAQADSTEDEVAVGADESAIYCFPVAPDSDLVRFDVDSADDTADLDLFTYEAPSCDDDPTALGPDSATASADESVTIRDPQAAAYYVEVNGFTAGDEGAPIPFRLDAYDVSPASTEGDLTADPDPLPVTQGEEATYTVSWSDLAADNRYLGFIEYGSTGLSTLVEVSTVSS